MRLQRNALAILLGSLLVVITLTTFLTNQLFVKTTAKTEETQYGLMKSIIQFNLAGAETRALARAELVASLPRVQELFAAGDRDGLAAEMKKMFEVQKDKFNVDQAQFHLPPATSFLRLNNPTKFGDDLSSFRPIVVAVNKDFVARKGLSISRSGPGIFGVVPVTDKTGKPIGTFEFGQAFGGILDSVKSAYGLESVVFIDEAKLKNAAPDLGGDVYAEKNRMGRFIKYQSTNWELMSKLVSDQELSAPGIENSPYQREAQDTPYGVVIHPLRNPAGDVLGMVVVAKDFSPSRSAMGQSTIWLIMFSLFGLVLLSGVVILLVRGAVMRPIAVLNQHFDALATGDRSQAIDSEEFLYKEIGTLAQHYETLRTQDTAAQDSTPSVGAP